ncbi:MAG: DUF3124 domain-containing protein [Desulfobacterales bacterium]|jgi:hypothetical protein|nr:DUF3124 domain-containing protein [Desulfobacterales bacterium]
MAKIKKILLILSLWCLFFFSAARAQVGIDLSKGQTVYVPAYSHIYSGDTEYKFMLAVTLSIRNTDLKNALTITSVDYFDTNGKLIKKYLNNPVSLAPMSSTRYVVKESDETGGSGANFIVIWNADQAVHSPIIESVMIGTRSQQGISFTSRGQVVSEVQE